MIALLAAVSLARAQAPVPPDARAGRADPLDPQARVPAAVHASSLAGFRRLGEDRRVDWKDANEVVNRIGGWRAYAREAQQPAPTPPASAPASRGLPAPAPAATRGAHPKHGGAGG